MDVTPVAACGWDGQSPIQNGMAVQVDTDRGFGGLGLAVRIRGRSFFTCARHVFFDQDTTVPEGGSDVEIWDSEKFIPCTRLRLDVEAKQPGRAQVPGGNRYVQLDTSFVNAILPAANVVKGFKPNPLARDPAVGDELLYRGPRDTQWNSFAYLGRFQAEEHGGAFDLDQVNPFDLTCFGVVDLKANANSDNLLGDSGVSLWAPMGRGAVSCLGHLVAVSNVRQLGLVVRYAPAFKSLGFGDDEYVAI
jgi:hypothetical protein